MHERKNVYRSTYEKYAPIRYTFYSKFIIGVLPRRYTELDW